MTSFTKMFDEIAPPEVLGRLSDLSLTGITDDSRAVVPGSVFIAVKGEATDGRKYVADAVAKGASVVVGEQLEPVDSAVMINVENARIALAKLAMRWYRLGPESTNGFKLLGVTGTNGKSTTAVMARAILQEAGRKCGLLGTMHYDLCSRSVVANLTTPGTLQLASHLRECIDAGAEAAVMEVSSHALDQHRTAGLKFAAAAFTNLTQDHLDYHKTFDNYLAAKTRLFANLESDAVAIVNRDDPRHEAIGSACPGKVVYYSIDNAADIRAKIIRNSVKGTLFNVTMEGKTLALENAIVGRHNVYNAMAAAGLARALGATFEEIEAGLAAVRNIPGRLQRVPGVQAAEVFVDYAHTDDALRNVASVLKPLTKKKFVVVFGCGGDRDRGKRPKMAAAVAEFADAIVLTSDNPRTEDPKQIIDDTLVGFDEMTRRKVTVESDRRQAITCALAGAEEGDVVLIAGKGHEDYQVIGTERIHFDDVEVAIEAAAALAGNEIA